MSITCLAMPNPAPSLPGKEDVDLLEECAAHSSPSELDGTYGYSRSEWSPPGFV